MESEECKPRKTQHHAKEEVLGSSNLRLSSLRTIVFHVDHVDERFDHLTAKLLKELSAFYRAIGLHSSSNLFRSTAILYYINSSYYEGILFSTEPHMHKFIVCNNVVEPRCGCRLYVCILFFIMSSSCYSQADCLCYLSGNGFRPSATFHYLNGKNFPPVNATSVFLHLSYLLLFLMHNYIQISTK